MGRLYLIQLDGRIYSCRYCRSHLALCEELVSKSFHCRHGRAYLFNTVMTLLHSRYNMEVCKYQQKAERAQKANIQEHKWQIVESVNVSLGPQEERMMTTGMHTVADIFCNCCGQIVGWKYEAAHEKSQKYKEGKFILERARMVDGDGTDFYLDPQHFGSEPDDVE